MFSHNKTDLIRTDKISHTRAQSGHQNLRDHFIDGITQANRTKLSHDNRGINFGNQSNKGLIEFLRKSCRLEAVSNEHYDVIGTRILEVLIKNGWKVVRPRTFKTTNAEKVFVNFLISNITA